MKRILIAETDLAIGMTYLRTFVVDGFKVEQVSGELHASHITSHLKPDIAIVSMQFPGSKSTRIIESILNASKSRAIPILAYSRAKDLTTESNAIRSGASDFIFIETPGAAELRNKVAQLLNLSDSVPKPQVRPAQPTPRSDAPATVRGTLAAPPTPSPTPPPSQQAKPAPPLSTPPQPPKKSEATPPSAPKPKIAATPPKQENAKPSPSTISRIPDTPSSENTDVQPLSRIKEIAQNLLRSEDQTVRRLITELSENAKILIRNEATPHPQAASRILNALYALLTDLVEDPEIVVSASIRRTILSAADFVESGFNNRSDSPDTKDRDFKILVVDDEPIAQTLVSAALGSVQLIPDTAEDPVAALELLQATRYALCILDINMPQMNGFELCQKIRRLPFCAKTPILFVTSARDFNSRLRFAQSGGDDFIAKPFLGTELATKALLHLLAR